MDWLAFRSGSLFHCFGCALDHLVGEHASPILTYMKFRSRSHDAVIRVFDGADNVIETHEHADDFKEW